jgi:mycothiol synthase
MLRWNEEHLRALAAGHPADRSLFFDSWAMQGEQGAHALFRSEGYAPARCFFDMVRPALDDLPDAPLPDGLEIRPVRREDIDRILDADNEAFRDHWGHREMTEQDRAALMAAPDTDPGIWVVAWDGNDPVGVATNTIYAADNKAFGRQRFWVDSLAVRRPWRRRGLGRALLVESLRLLRERGMTSAALGVDSENPTGALGLHERVGFVVEKTSTLYRKPLTAGATA